MNSRERITCALNHKSPDRLPVDFGGTSTSGIHVSIVYKLRQHFGLDIKGTPVKVIEPYQMLGEIKDDLKNLMGIDVASIGVPGTFFGFNKENWKEWDLWDGTPLLVPEKFNTDANSDGSYYQYAEGDKNYSPAAIMPRNGYFFDSLNRQKPFIEEDLNPYDNTGEYKALSDSDLFYISDEVNKKYNNTSYALVGSIASSGFGDIAFVPGPMLKEPRGIRDVTEWYISTLTRKDYIKKVFDIQCKIAIENYERVHNLIDDKIVAAFTSATDFGTQDRLFISADTYRQLYKSFHKKVNNWIHENTGWKSFIHTCGAIYQLIPEFIDAGFDIINPVQISAQGMDPVKLKKNYGRNITFWGGGVDTQKTLALGSPKDVREEVKKMIEIFNEGGGFVFSTVHNIQGNVPIENVLAVIETIRKYR